MSLKLGAGYTSLYCTLGEILFFDIKNLSCWTLGISERKGERFNEKRREIEDHVMFWRKWEIGCLFWSCLGKGLGRANTCKLWTYWFGETSSTILQLSWHLFFNEPTSFSIYDDLVFFFGSKSCYCTWRKSLCPNLTNQRTRWENIQCSREEREWTSCSHQPTNLNTTCHAMCNRLKRHHPRPVSHKAASRSEQPNPTPTIQNISLVPLSRSLSKQTTTTASTILSANISD